MPRLARRLKRVVSCASLLKKEATATSGSACTIVARLTAHLVDNGTRRLYLRVVTFMQVQVTAVFCICKHLTCFREHRLRDGSTCVDAAFCSQKIGFAPLFPCLQRLAVHLRRKAHAEPFLEMKSDDRDLGAAWKIRAVLPQRPVSGLVALPNLQRFDSVATSTLQTD